jgi:hypothetical protein
MSADERAALLSRVRVVEDGIVSYREIPVQTVASIELMMARMEELAARWPRFVEVLDLCEARRPSPEVRAVIRRRLREIGPRLARMTVVCGDNPVIRAVAKFLSYAMGIPATFHDTELAALEEARRVLRAR